MAAIGVVRMQAQGHYPGILAVRRDNAPKRDLTPSGIVPTLRNLLAAKIPLRDNYVILNHFGGSIGRIVLTADGE